MPRRDLVCPVCSKAFITYKTRNKTCSPACMGELRSRQAVEARMAVVCPVAASGARWLPLTRGKFVLVDADVYDDVIQHAWRFVGRDVSNNDAYVLRQLRSRERIYLHKYVMGISDGQVDHRDGNKLDCRRCNLRPATKVQNGGNRRKCRRTTTSAFKGVSREGKRWVARVSDGNGRRRPLGLFDTQEEAARAYDAGALLRWGEFARLNFPP